MKMNNLLGISGNINNGKDLVGEMLQYFGDEVNDPTFERFLDYSKPQKYRASIKGKYEIKKCADKLKECICLLLGCTRTQLEDRNFKERELGEEWWIYTDDISIVPYLGGDKKILDGYNTKLVKLSPRKLLQLLGTEGGRNVVHPNIWVNALFSDYKPMGAICCGDTFGDIQMFGGCTCKLNDFRFPNWIITDVRFPKNEGIGVTRRDGLLIGIRRYFALRFPEYAYLSLPSDPYAVPDKLKDDNAELYINLTHESEISMGDHSWCDSVIENNGTIEELFNKLLKINLR